MTILTIYGLDSVVDLNHLSSHMCVLPASGDPDYEDCTKEIRVENLQDVRALQGSAGSVFLLDNTIGTLGNQAIRSGRSKNERWLLLATLRGQLFASSTELVG